MKYTFILNNKKYMFAFFESDANHIILVSDPGNDNEKVTYIPCNVCKGYSIKINKKSLSSENGAYGIIRFIRDCYMKDICICYINKIIDIFGDWKSPLFLLHDIPGNNICCRSDQWKENIIIIDMVIWSKSERKEKQKERKQKEEKYQKKKDKKKE